MKYAFVKILSVHSGPNVMFCENFTTSTNISHLLLLFRSVPANIQHNRNEQPAFVGAFGVVNNFVFLFIRVLCGVRFIDDSSLTYYVVRDGRIEPIISRTI